MYVGVGEEVVTTPENGGRRRKRGREAARRGGGMAEPNGLARSSRYSGVAGGCSVETKARDKAVVTDGIKEMEELPGTLCTSRELWLCGKGVAPWQDVARVAAKRLHASGSLVPLRKERIKTAHAKHNWVEAIFSAGEEIDEHGRTTGSLLLVERGEDRIGRYDTFDDG